MLRSKQNAANINQCILLCDNGGHRLGLDVDGVERLVKTLLSYCNKDATAHYRLRYNRRSNFKLILASPDAQRELVVALRDLLGQANREVSGNVLAQVHHTIGIIHQRNNNPISAKNAFLQALWIQSSCPGTPRIDLGLTKVGLAMEYGRIGSYHEAIQVLTTAVGDFQIGLLPEDHEAWTLVSNAMSTFQLASEKKRILSMKNSRGRRKNLLTRPSPAAGVGRPEAKSTQVEERGQPSGIVITQAARSKTPPMLGGARSLRTTRSKTPPMAAACARRSQI